MLCARVHAIGLVELRDADETPFYNPEKMHKGSKSLGDNVQIEKKF